MMLHFMSNVNVNCISTRHGVWRAYQRTWKHQEDDGIGGVDLTGDAETITRTPAVDDGIDVEFWGVWIVLRKRSSY